MRHRPARLSLTLTVFALSAFCAFPTYAQNETPSLAQADTSQSPDEQVNVVIKAILQAYQQQKWAELGKLTDQLENILTENDLWSELSPEQSSLVRRNIATWRGDGARETGRFSVAQRQYEAAVHICDETQDRGRECVITRGKLALVYRTRGNYPRSHEMFIAAQKDGEEIFGVESIDNATALANIALILESMGRYREASQYFAKAVPLYEKTAGSKHPFTGLAYNNWALNFHSTGKFGEAEKLFRKALSVLASSGLPENHEYIAAALGGLAITLNDLGKPQEAEIQSRKAISNWNKSKGPDHPQTNLAIANLATILLAQNRAAEAEQYFARALARARKQFGDAHMLSARFSSNLGISKMRQKKYQSAVQDIRNAVDWGARALGEDHSDLGLYYNNLAAALSNVKEFAEAEVAARRAIKIMRKAIGEDNPRLVEAYANLGLLQMFGGDQKAAEISLRDALKQARKIPGKPGYPLLLALNSLTLFIAPNDATNDEALALSREAIHIIAAQRQVGQEISKKGDSAIGIPLDSTLRPGASDEASFGFHMKILGARAKALPDEESELLAEMFVTAQNASLSSAAKAMSQTAARTASGNGALANLVREQQDLSRAFSTTNKKIETALVSGAQSKVESLQKELSGLAMQFTKVNAELNLKFPQYTDLVSPKARDISGVQKRLGDDDGLLLIFPSIKDIFLLAVTKDQITWSRRKQKQQKLETSIERLRCQMDPATCAKNYFAGEALSDAQLEGYRSYDRQMAYQVYQELFSPIEEIFARKNHIFVVSNGKFAGLPLSALIDKKPETGDNADPDILAATSWLGDRYAFTSLPAVSALEGVTGKLPQNGQSETSSPKWSFTGYGAPSIGDIEEQANRPRSAGSSGFFRAATTAGLSLADPASLRQLSALPGTKRELVAMASALGADEQSIIVGDSATETAIRTNQTLAASTVIIFATHGLLPGDLEGLDEPALVFTPPQKASLLDDGVLSASEASELKLDARWVILSACNTASAEGQGGGDSLSGLSRAFLFAGAKSLLASNWRVGDEETAVLTVETIKADRSSPQLGRARALQKAMRIVRTGKREDGSAISEWTPEWIHPASWAPFIHISNSH